VIHAAEEAVTAALARLHAQRPLLCGAALNEVAAAVAKSPDERAVFRLAVNRLRDSGALTVIGDRLALACHEPQWLGRDAAARGKILAFLGQVGIAVPPLQEFAERLGLSETALEGYLRALLENGVLSLLAPKLYCLPAALEAARAKVIAHLEVHDTLAIGEARELLGASRKFLLPLLEGMDADGITRREGNVRVLR
jgi:selenocysteine-specific elongation factor